MVTNNKKIEQVATISANNDNVIGKLLIEAMAKAKRRCNTVEEAKGTDTTVEVVEGMESDRGYISPYFITDVDKQADSGQSINLIYLEENLSYGKNFIVLFVKNRLQTGKTNFTIAEDVDEKLY